MTLTPATLAVDTATFAPDGFVAAVLNWVRACLAGEDADAARRNLDAARSGSVLDHISRLFRLTPADEDLMLFALAHRVDGSIAPLCAGAVGDIRQSYVTAHLLTQTLAGGDTGFAAALFERLTAAAPLRRHGLVELREAHPLSAISLPEDLACRFLELRRDPVPAGCQTLPEAPGLERFARTAADLAPQLRQGLALVGPAGGGRRALASHIARHCGKGAVRVDLSALPDTVAARSGWFRNVARDAALDDLLLVITTDQVDAGTQEGAGAGGYEHGKALIAELLDVCNGGELIVIARDPTGLPAALYRARVAPMQVSEREAIWTTALGSRGNPEEVADVARQFPFGPEEIGEIAAGMEAGAAPGTLWARCRSWGGQGLEALATRIVPRFGWTDLVLPGAVLGELRAIADQLRHRTRVYDEWGFAQRLSTGRGVTALFAGPSGTGKTMAAEVIANDLGLDLYKVDLSRLVSKYIGETEKNLRRVFDAAEETGACLFLDEADACLGKRSEVKDSHDRHANIEVSYLLQRMESFSGLCLLATNLKNNLDSAFLRRLRFVVDIPFPDQGDRLRIWQGAFPEGTPTQGLDFAALSRLDVSGGSIVVIAVNAAFLAAAAGQPVKMEHIADAARGEYRKFDRTFRASWDKGGS